MRGKSLLLMTLSLLLVLGLGGGIGGLWEEARAEEPAPPATRLLASPVGTAFTYQGRLVKDGNPVNGTCDFTFGLYDVDTGGTPIDGALLSSVGVSNGLFTVQLNFGADDFTGEARWLGIAVKCGGDADFTTLTPRQPLTPTPYALALPGLWTQQNATSPNVIGGHSSNSVTDGVYGATIGGGGSSPSMNRVTDAYGTVSGGAYNQAGDDSGNTADAPYATVGGGSTNSATGNRSTVGGGDSNTASASGATVGGGSSNTANGDSATVGGGESNTASDWYTTVGGGEWNTASGRDATVGGGRNNAASADYATVAGGLYANASHYGEMAHASGRFAAVGDAQASVYVMRIERACTAGVWFDLYLDGNAALPAHYLAIATGRTMTFDGLVVGRSNAAGGNKSAGYWIRGVVENVGGTATLVSWSRTTLGEDDTAWDARVATLGDDLFVQVQGNGETIRWVATMRTAEVAW